MPKVVDHGERREAVVSLAAQLIAKDGLAAVSFKGIADAAGASTTLVSHYFENKRELLLYTYRALLSRSQAEQRAVVERSDAGILDLAEVLLPLRPEQVGAWRISIEFFSAALSDAEFRREWERNLKFSTDCFQAMFGRMVERGELDPAADRRRDAARRRSAACGAADAGADPRHWHRSSDFADTVVGATTADGGARTSCVHRASFQAPCRSTVMMFAGTGGDDASQDSLELPFCGAMIGLAPEEQGGR